MIKSKSIVLHQYDILFCVVACVDVIEGRINSLQKAQVGVAVISKMNSPHGLSVDAASEMFAVEIHNGWKVGDAASQNGVLLFLSIQDRAVFISVVWLKYNT